MIGVDVGKPSFHNRGAIGGYLNEQITLVAWAGAVRSSGGKHVGKIWRYDGTCQYSGHS